MLKQHWLLSPFKISQEKFPVAVMYTWHEAARYTPTTDTFINEDMPIVLKWIQDWQPAVPNIQPGESRHLHKKLHVEKWKM